ncbi:enoyl-CoA hydratase/isomerase family protein [Onchocerca flexuosa]|uniref:enoyl-CoA hydratase n=1 Tax=Onchocerca flexuosa TaxID=387005 RepID=A0A238BNW5_9BILA|nr:enoyl-CoA hydratase/isomerase family protein [Onchocerca flexuosa]
MSKVVRNSWILASCSTKILSVPWQFQRCNFASAMHMIKTEKVGDKRNVGLIKLHRPKTLNALCSQLMQELSDALVNFENDSSIGAVVLTGSKRVFSMGADIKELFAIQHEAVSSGNTLQNWTQISKMKKPIIAAVNGHALGGGCELAMMCDIIYAGEEAKFGQPEVIIGTIPGAGGTQRWLRVTGKSLAMEVCLTGIPIGAHEAKERGLISKVFPVDQVELEAIKTAEKISEHSPLIVSLVKDAVNHSYETFLQEGLRYEMLMIFFFQKDLKEGMKAFMEKRRPEWTSS